MEIKDNRTKVDLPNTVWMMLAYTLESYLKSKCPDLKHAKELIDKINTAKSADDLSLEDMSLANIVIVLQAITRSVDNPYAILEGTHGKQARA